MSHHFDYGNKVRLAFSTYKERCRIVHKADEADGVVALMNDFVLSDVCAFCYERSANGLNHLKKKSSVVRKGLCVSM